MSGSTRSAVSGMPSSLLNDPAVATVGPASARTAASRSLVEVLPCDPVSGEHREAVVVAHLRDDVRREPLQGGLRVLDHDRRQPGRAGAEHRDRSVGRGLRRVVVAVGVLADEGDEQAARAGLPAVDDHRTGHDHPVAVPLDPAADDVGDHLE